MVQSKAKSIIRIIVAVILLVFIMFPLFTLILTSVKSFDDVLLRPTSVFPTEWEFNNFIIIFREFPFLRYGANSVLVTFLSCLGTVLTSSLVAYGFARFEFKYKELIFFVMLATMFIPSQVLQIPTFELYRELKWFNTYYPFIVPCFLGGGIVNVFLVRNFIQTIPKSIYEASEVDGASPLRIFLSIAVPLSKPIILTVAIFSFVGAWNDFFSPLLYLNNNDMYTLAYGLYITFSKFEIAGNTAWHLISAADLVVILPIILLYFFFQKYFIAGITLGGVKE